MTHPLFFQQLTNFLAGIPSSALLKGEGKNKKHTPHFQTLLNNYLHYYQLDTIATQTPCHHTIWQSNITANNNISYRIVQQCWQPKSSEKPKGSIVIVHGYLDHTGLYHRLIAWALAQDYQVFCFDLPGHGLSSGAPAAIDDFSTYSEIFNQVLREAIQQNIITPPLYAIGQSTGCAVISYALLHQTTPYHFERVILLAPLVRIPQWRILRYVYRLLRPLISSVKRGFVASSHDEQTNHFIHHLDPLQATRIPLNWLGAMDAWYVEIKQKASSQINPSPQALTIIQGTGDSTVDWKYNLPQLQQCFPNSQTHYIEHARHHLVKESNTYWQAIVALLNRTIK